MREGPEEKRERERKEERKSEREGEGERQRQRDWCHNTDIVVLFCNLFLCFLPEGT